MHMSLQSSEFLKYFVDGKSWMTSSGDTITLSISRVGKLYLPSGRLIACDPAIPDDLPFEQAFSPGAYPVDVMIVHIREHLSPFRSLWFRFSRRLAEDTRIALAAVVFQGVLTACLVYGSSRRCIYSAGVLPTVARKSLMKCAWSK